MKFCENVVTKDVAVYCFGWSRRGTFAPPTAHIWLQLCVEIAIPGSLSNPGISGFKLQIPGPRDLIPGLNDM